MVLVLMRLLILVAPPQLVQVTSDSRDVHGQIQAVRHVASSLSAVGRMEEARELLLSLVHHRETKVRGGVVVCVRLGCGGLFPLLFFQRISLTPHAMMRSDLFGTKPSVCCNSWN